MSSWVSLVSSATPPAIIALIVICISHRTAAALIDACPRRLRCAPNQLLTQHPPHLRMALDLAARRLQVPLYALLATAPIRASQGEAQALVAKPASERRW
jgi:hypothetical protein